MEGSAKTWFEQVVQDELLLCFWVGRQEHRLSTTTRDGTNAIKDGAEGGKIDEMGG